MRFVEIVGSNQISTRLRRLWSPSGGDPAEFMAFWLFLERLEPARRLVVLHFGNNCCRGDCLLN